MNQSGREYRWWASVDHWAETPFMPSHPITILHNKQQKMVPFMTGINSDEGNQIYSMWDIHDMYFNNV